LSVAGPQALDVCNELLNRFRHAECVGPMLGMRGTPPSHNPRENGGIEQPANPVREVVDTSFGLKAFVPARFVTSFALHRAGEPFRTTKSGLRVWDLSESLTADGGVNTTASLN
jgi:hypothetical protein